VLRDLLGRGRSRALLSPHRRMRPCLRRRATMGRPPPREKVCRPPLTGPGANQERNLAASTGPGTQQRPESSREKVQARCQSAQGACEVVAVAGQPTPVLLPGQLPVGVAPVVGCLGSRGSPAPRNRPPHGPLMLRALPRHGQVGVDPIGRLGAAALPGESTVDVDGGPGCARYPAEPDGRDRAERARGCPAGAPRRRTRSRAGRP
jgi:hypothetical protein